MVFVPEYVVGRWWEQLLHNQSALRLKARLLFLPGVMVANVPWQLESSVAATEDDEEVRARPGDLRRGVDSTGLPLAEVRPELPTDDLPASR